MSYTRKIAHNTIIQMVGKATSTVIGVVVVAMLTRYLGRSGYGHYTTIMAFLQFFGVLVDMGLYVILVKKISEPGVDENNIVSNIFTLRLLTAVLFLGLAPVAVLFFPYPPMVKIGVMVTTFSFLAISLNQILIGVFQKKLRMDKVVIAEMAGRLVLLAGIFFVVEQNLGLIQVMWAVVFGSIFNFLFTFLFSRRFIRIKLSFDKAVWKQVIMESWPIALSIAFNLVYFKADTIILSLYQPAEAVGIYGAAYKVLEVLTTFPAVFAGLVLPLLAGAWAARDREKFQRVMNKAVDAMVIISIPLAVGTIFVAHPVMDLIAPEFNDSAKVLQFLIVATAIIFIGNLFGNAVVAINKQKMMMWLYLGVAIVSLVGYLIFIPRYSYFGAASMTIVSELLVTCSAAMVVLRYARIKIFLKNFTKAAFSSMIMAGILYILRGYNIFIVLGTGVFSYLLLMYVLGGISREIIKEITRIQQ